MATNETTIAARPEQVYDVLLDPETYPGWVVGCDDIRDVDSSWPAVGARFHHTVGAGPVKVKDNTKLMSSEPPRRLELEARARPAGVATVVFELEPTGDGTLLRIIEFPKRGLAKTLHNPAFEAMIKARNVETLRRLKNLVENGAKA